MSTYSSQPPRGSELGLSETALVGGVYGHTCMAQYQECPRVPVEQVGTQAYGRVSHVP